VRSIVKSLRSDFLKTLVSLKQKLVTWAYDNYKERYGEEEINTPYTGFEINPKEEEERYELVHCPNIETNTPYSSTV
jgi:hypothetical protein